MVMLRRWWPLWTGLALGLAWPWVIETLPSREDPHTYHALVSLGLLVASLALSYAAGYLLSKKNKATIKDDKPTTLVSRGSYLTWVRGVRRVAPMFAWAGNRRSAKEKSGKKGGALGGQKVKVWYEEAMHLLCVGPAWALHRIIVQGKVVFTGPITRVSHPSGTYVDIGTEGGFTIYWGEPTQPPNTFLGDDSRLGVTSRWPYHCYVVWDDKRLGQAAHWPLIEYEIEVRCENSRLVRTDPQFAPTRTLSGTSETIVDIDTAGATDYFELEGSHAPAFPATTVVRLTGNACPDQDFEVLFSEAITVEILPQIFVQRTRVHFTSGTLTGCDANGQLTPFEAELNQGINAAHAMDEALHAPWPLGLGIVPDTERQVFDLESLEVLGELMVAEDLRTSWIALDGDSVQTLIGAAMQDLGVMAPMDWADGLIKFTAIREPSGTIRRLREEVVVDRLPEIETLQPGARQANSITFTFPDRLLLDRDQPITFDDDGQISYAETQQARSVQITVSTDFDTSAAIASRRSQEELGRGPKLDFVGNRATRTLLPGEPVIMDGQAELQRILEIDRNAEDNRVGITSMADYYGVAVTPFLGKEPPTPGGSKEVEPDIQKAIVEVPEYVLGADAFTVLVPRIRAHEQVSEAGIFLSRTNSSYTFVGTELDFQTGGVLDAALPAGGAQGARLLEQGPIITRKGPDIDQVLDLSSDLEGWRSGRQICIISSTAGTEICFLQAITGLGGDSWRLNGLMRARWDTQSLAHPAGAEVYIFEQDSVLDIKDGLLAVGVELFAKTQPQANGVLPLDADIPERVEELYGKGRSGRPVPADGLEVSSPRLSNAVYASEDLGLRWTYGTPQSQQGGAGLFPAGQALANYPVPDGDFVLEFLTTGGTVVRTESLASNSYTYLAADLASDFASNDFRVRLRQRRGGLLSDPVEITIENYV